MNLTQREFEERRIALYEREVKSREKQAEALETIARRLFVSAQETTQKTSQPKLSFEKRVEIGRKVAALRINAEGSSGVAWWKIREKLNIGNNEFHKWIRPEDHFKEAVVKRIESFEGGWECHVDLERLCGFEPTGEWLDRIKACKPRRKI